MNRALLFLITFLSLPAAAQTAFTPADEALYRIRRGNPDIVIQTIFNQSAQKLIVSELRRALSANIGLDPMKFRFEKPVVISGNLKTDSKPAEKKLIDGLLGIPLDETKATVEMTGLQYDIKDAVLEIAGVCNSPEGGLDIDLYVSLSNTLVTADDLMITFASPAGKEKSYLDNMHVRLKSPSVYSPTLSSLTVQTTVQVRANGAGTLEIRTRDSTYDIFKNVTLESLRKDVALDFGDVELSDVTIEIGNGRMPLRHDGIRDAIEIRKPNIASLMLKPLVGLIQSLPEKVLRRKIEALTVPLTYALKLPIAPGSLLVHSFGQVGADQLRLAFDYAIAGANTARDEDPRLERSLVRIEDQIESRAANVVVSVSESLLNHLTASAVDAALAGKLPKGLSIGPKKIFTVMSGTQPFGTLVADLIVDTGRMGGIVLGKRRLHFPLVAYPELSFGKQGNIPTLNLRIARADLSDQALLDGAHGVDSNLRKIRLKKAILKKIRAKINDALAKAEVAVPLPALENTDLTFVRFENDGLGRFNMLLTLDPDSGEDVRSFWGKVPFLIRKAFAPK